MALHLHRADRTDLLVDGLGALLADPLPDPFAEELVLVSARGMERWLSQRLSHVLGGDDRTDGVCAGVSFRSPASLVAEITGTVDDDPWSPEAMTWPLLDAIDANLAEDWLRTLATHLGHYTTNADEAELRRGRRYAVARRLAGLFASYARQRPALLADWESGTAGGVDPDLRWQPPLWRALVERIDADPPHTRHATTLARLREGPSELPQRLSLFGHTRLPATDIELLQALATHHDLHLWLPHPSDDLWQRLTDVHETVRRKDDASRHRANHPLLDTLGRDVRELQRTLPPGDVDEFIGAATRPDTLLGWLQSDICANQTRPGSRLLTQDDRSVQVHSCHGAARQIDVLRDVLLGLLEDDASLEPRDILVMCPDIETYAPLIVAAFGLGEVPGKSHPAHRLRVRLADRSLVQTNPLLGVASQLLDIADTRATASQVLNLAQAAPVRARFTFSDDDLDTMSQWVRQSEIRWGFDADHRGRYRLDHFAQNTWRFGLDRILTGVAMSDDSHAWIDTALPLDDVGSDRVDLAGRFADYVDRLTAVADRLTGCHPLAEWLDALNDGIGALTRVSETDVWQTGQLDREFSKVLAEAGTRVDTLMRLTDVRSLLAGHLAGRPTRANFRTGTLTVCTMVPMRSVPHRVVCLVGLDDGVFPRLDLPDGDDALARRPMTGERDIRSEDRQLLLDAICAATETLVITYTGNDEHTGARRPPAVPLQELLDALDGTTPDPISHDIVVAHPLQPFDLKNVERGGVVKRSNDKPFTFDPTVLRAAQAAAGERTERQSFFTVPVADLPRGDIELTDLLRFFRHPVEGYFRELDYTLPWEVDGVEDAMCVELDALEQWSIGDRLVNDLMRGVDLEVATIAERLRGGLPPGVLGERKAKELSDEAAELAMEALRYQSKASSAHHIDVGLGGGRHLTGTVTPVYKRGVVSVTYSRLAPKHVLQAWVSLVALGASGHVCAAACIGRGDRNEIKARVFQMPPNPAHVLSELVSIFDAGRREPLPLPLKTSCGWAEKRRQGRDPVLFARNKWEDGKFPERDDQAFEKIWGKGAKFDVLLSDTPHDGEYVDGEDTRFGALATRLWMPILDSEVRVG